MCIRDSLHVVAGWLQQPVPWGHSYRVMMGTFSWSSDTAESANCPNRFPTIDCRSMKSKGMVYLVGAGPGDVGLITVRGAELLARADVVVYDALSNPDLLRLAPKTAEFIFGGKRAKEHIIPQSEINRLLVNKAKEGKIVVRLKGGDPYVFGRGGEEAEALADARVPFEVVPGVSSFVAVPTYAGIPVTHREHSSKLSIITGYEDPTKEGASIDWR